MKEPLPLILRILFWLTILYSLLLLGFFFIDLWGYTPLKSEVEYLHWNVPPLSGIPAKFPDYIINYFIPLLPLFLPLFLPLLIYPVSKGVYRLYRRSHS